MFQSQKDIEDKIKAQKRQAEEEDAKRRAEKHKLPYLNLLTSKSAISIEALSKVKEADAKEGMLAPIKIVSDKMLLALFDPENKKAQEIINNLKEKYEVIVNVVSKTSLEYAWSYYKYIVPETEISGSVKINEEELKKLFNGIKTIKDVNFLLANFSSPYLSKMLEIILSGAISLKASDIHLEPREKVGVLRYRIDGFLYTAYENFEPFTYKSIITRIKLLSNLKINISNEPQDGRFTIKLPGRDIEIRTSIIPSDYGETAVLRLLDPSALKINLEELGWRKDDLEIVSSIIKRPNGLILNTGPTGSGKTTTLYAFLKKIFKPEIKIITVEDPIEYHLPGISQTQVNPDVGYTFASGLRSILRQDPDVILIGEIRDRETAEIALNASLTGHLVFSTLHTNDSIGAIPRLLDLGIQPNILGPALTLVIAQRLVRVLCPQCKKEEEISDDLKQKIDNFISKLPPRVDKNEYLNYKIYKPVGCGACSGLGYKGRTSIFELFVVDEKIEELIYKNPTEIEIKKAAKENGLVTLQEDGILKALKGITSFEEVERMTGPLEFN
jgi:type II secretory ATPase GspE/PulE/Tfp pilus assembly ATPase PilB-like protein